MARRALNPDPSWWCPTCRAGRAGDACTTCGLLRELAPRDPGVRREPVIEDVELRGYIVSQVLEPERLPGWEWPWLTYVLIIAAIALIVRAGVLNAYAQWLGPVFALAFVAFLAIVLLRRQWLRTFGARYLSRLWRRQRLRYVLNVERADDNTSVQVTIDAPRPWPPLGPDARTLAGAGDDATLRQEDSTATVTFVGGWHPEGRFIADRIIPPAITGRPVVVASGHAQALLWLGAIAGTILIIRAVS